MNSANRSSAASLDLAERAAQYYWHHSIDLGQGVVTKGFKSPSLLSEEAGRVFDRVDIVDRTVLDVGAWNGYFSFEAKRRGAARVLATDSCTWTHPVFRGRETFDLASEELGLAIDTREIDVAEMTPENVGEFDIVLFLGVFYHRYDAIDVLAKVARLAKKLLIVETQLDLRKFNRPAMAFYPHGELSGDSSNWWAPNELCMDALLRGHGFAEIETTSQPEFYYRAIFHAWRSVDLRLARVPEHWVLKSEYRNTRAKIIRELRRPFRRWLP